jgi:group II intron reverse transcriptase/maturase
MLSSKVRELQSVLYEAAKADPKRRFYSLRDKVQRMDVLTDAWKQVKRNKDKSDGGKRPLGIPTVRDRVVQGALKIVIEPIFEADFKDCSYGYRPNRSANDAHQEIRKQMNFGYTEVMDADIKGFFDNISHEILMREIERRIADGWVLKLIRAILRAKVIEPDGRGHKPKKGTPQGGVISPLFANIYLHQLDREWEASGMSDSWGGWDARLIRYADDLVILMRRWMVDRPVRKLEEVLGKIGLELNPGKTRVTTVVEGFDFLGFHFVRRRSQKSDKVVTYSFPNKGAVQRAKEKINEITEKRLTGWMKSLKVISRLNRSMKGWAEYYSYSNAHWAFRAVQHYMNQKVRKFLRRRKGRKGFGYKEYPDSFLYEKLGLINLTGKGSIKYVSQPQHCFEECHRKAVFGKTERTV